ncbi:MAG: hypothetical protein IKS07_07595, partial [Lachnospiraceae bacterium]|nr:hypothetical protein [Lachnospiraceae bacterium]
MRKLKSLVFGGLQQKLFNLCLVLTVLTMLVFTLVGIAALKGYQDLVLASSEEQKTEVGQMSAAAMENVVEQALLSNAEAVSFRLDDVFADFYQSLQVVAEMTTDIYAHPEDYPSMSLDGRPRDEAGELKVQLMHSEGVNLYSVEMQQELKRLFHLQELLAATVERSSTMFDCFVMTTSGAFLIADRASEGKTDDNGQPIDFDPTSRDWYNGALQTGKPYFTAVDRDFYTGVSQVMCGIPIYHDGEIVAVVGGSLSVEDIRLQVAQLQMGTSGFGVVINQNGELVFSSREEGMFGVQGAEGVDYREAEQETGAAVASALLGGSGFTKVKFEDQSWYMAYALMKTVGWASFLVVSETDILASSDALVNQMNASSASARETLVEQGRNLVRLTIILATVLLLIAVTAALVFAERIVHPLNEMSRHIQGLSEEDPVFVMRPVYETGDEVEELAKAFAVLSGRTREYIEQVRTVTAEKERISSELSVATKIQADMLPCITPLNPGRHEVRMAASMSPAKEVGGDFYDFFMIGEDKLGL